MDKWYGAVDMIQRDEADYAIQGFLVHRSRILFHLSIARYRLYVKYEVAPVINNSLPHFYPPPPFDA